MKFIPIFLSFIILFSSTITIASDTTIGVVKTLKGTASLERNKQIRSLKIGDPLFEKDIIITSQNGSMGAILRDDSLISIGSNTRIVFTEFIFKPADKNVSTIIRITKGTMNYLSGLIVKINGNAVKVETPSAVCGLRGTNLAIKVED